MGIWKIKDADKGIFTVKNAHRISGLYFPLTNTQGDLLSCITPNLSGDLKTGINNFLNYPQTVYDLNAMSSTRTMWLQYNGKTVNTSPLYTEPEQLEVEAGPLYHILRSRIDALDIEILNFVPEKLSAEVMRFTVTNRSSKPISVKAVFAMPLFCRSADNLRDHRHVTALLSRSSVSANGVTVKPTMAFDERGHTVNTTEYFAYGYRNSGLAPKRVISSLDGFLGEGGTLYRPGYIYEPSRTPAPVTAEGREPFCGLDFGTISLKSGASTTFTVIMGITDKKPAAFLKQLDTTEKVDKALQAGCTAWQDIFNTYRIHADKTFSFWSAWVNMQPTLRKLYGCSFLPHFDYGRGGRGWRDLWQDLLGLLLFDPSKTRDILINNFKGVRMDGSNATIITGSGGFLADRNKISRVWMDHAVWPWLTLKLYIDQTGDLDVLFEKLPWFKDNQLKRAAESDPAFPEKDNRHRTSSGKVHESSLFEHTLLANLVQFYNVGEHGNTKLEDADWNDGLDMGHHKGESVAFSCMYAHNLAEMADVLEAVRDRKGVDMIELTAELAILLGDGAKAQQDPAAKRRRLEKYFNASKNNVSGKMITINIEKLAADLRAKAQAFGSHIRRQEWLKTIGTFNGYYDNAGRRVEGVVNNARRITLTSGVFSLMSGVATDTQAATVYKTLSQTLKEKKYGTFRLNTNFKEVKLDLGRAFAFSYGDKENGAIFAHMDVMFAFSLYRRGFVQEGWQLVKGLASLATGEDARTYPCISEYYNSDYRGLYNFLTGSASWYTYLLVTQIFGLKHAYGDLTLEPRLTREQFGGKKELSITASIDGRPCTVVYRNPQNKEYGQYAITAITVNGVTFPVKDRKVFTLDRMGKKALLVKKQNEIVVTLG